MWLKIKSLFVVFQELMRQFFQKLFGFFRSDLKEQQESNQALVLQFEQILASDLKLRSLANELLSKIIDVGDEQGWTNAAETQRVYTWMEFQELDKFLKANL